MSDRLPIAEPLPAFRPVASRPSSMPGALLPILLTCGACLLLYARSLAGPVLFSDDFRIVAQSRTWQRTWAGLWVPQNEHAMPLGRLFCFALEALTGRLPLLPYFTSLVGPGALLLGLWLLYVFIRREMGHSFYALLTIILFAVTSVYHQAVWWFAASFAILSLDTMLLGLLAAQRWRQTGRGFYLVLTVLACLLAPGWFALGALAGPLCCLYLMPPDRQQAVAAGFSLRRLKPAATGAAGWCFCLLPLIGTALFLAISLPRTAHAILHTGHYGDKTAMQAFDPRIGLAYTARSLVDNLLLGLVGVTDVALPWGCVALILAVAVAVGVWWWYQARDRRLMLLGLGLIGSTYLLCYSARALWDYETMVEPRFSRYHLLPHLGLVLFFCGGLPGRAGRWFTLDATGTLTQRQRRMVYGLIGICFLIQLPRGLICGSPTGWDQFKEVRQQQAALRRIEEIDARCRRYHIAADAARQALGRLDVAVSYGEIDGWELLIGSDDPQELPPEEIQRLLEAP